MTINLNTIDDLILFIDKNNIDDYDKINELCNAMLQKTFFGLKFGDTPYTKHYFLSHLRSYRNELSADGTSERFFLNFSSPFSVKDFI